MQQNSFGILLLVLIIGLTLIVTQGIVTVDAGNIGVVKRFGKVQEDLFEPGLNFKMPIITQVIEMNTRVQKIEVDVEASSKDLQEITSKMVLAYRIDSAKAGTIYNELGLEYPHTIVQPLLQESIKATSARYTAEELITKRADVAQEMEEDLIARLKPKDIVPTDLSIIDFSFSKEFNDAIEAKQVAQQAALRAQNELDRIRIEAQQAEAEALGKADAELARAQAEAEAQKLLRETISPELLMLRAIERWDGKLPIYSGGDLPQLFLQAPMATP